MESNYIKFQSEDMKSKQIKSIQDCPEISKPQQNKQVTNDNDNEYTGINIRSLSFCQLFLSPVQAHAGILEPIPVAMV